MEDHHILFLLLTVVVVIALALTFWDIAILKRQVNALSNSYDQAIRMVESLSGGRPGVKVAMAKAGRSPRASDVKAVYAKEISKEVVIAELEQDLDEGMQGCGNKGYTTQDGKLTYSWTCK